jgi:hypothetical protein
VLEWAAASRSQAWASAADTDQLASRGGGDDGGDVCSLFPVRRRSTNSSNLSRRSSHTSDAYNAKHRSLPLRACPPVHSLAGVRGHGGHGGMSSSSSSSSNSRSSSADNTSAETGAMLRGLSSESLPAVLEADDDAEAGDGDADLGWAPASQGGGLVPLGGVGAGAPGIALRLLKLLLLRGADPHARLHAGAGPEARGDTALHVACRHGLVGAVRSLAPVSALAAGGCGDERASALHVASRAGQVEVLAVLLAAADVAVEGSGSSSGSSGSSSGSSSNSGSTSSARTSSLGPATAARRALCGLRTAGHGETPLFWAARAGHAAAVELLVAAGGADVSAERELDGATPLSLATLYNHRAVVEVTTSFGFEALRKTVYSAIAVNVCVCVRVCIFLYTKIAGRK